MELPGHDVPLNCHRVEAQERGVPLTEAHWTGLREMAQELGVEVEGTPFGRWAGGAAAKL